ncbi:MAG: endonuclease MutS2, partial [Cellulosilyticaceae bacterium]
MINETFEKLQYNTLKERVESYCVSPMGKKLIRKLTPSPHLKVVTNRLQETEEAKRLLHYTGTAPLQGIGMIDEILEKIEKDIILNEEQLSAVADFLAGCRKMQRFMKDKTFDAPTLYHYTLGIQTFESIEEEINACIRHHKVCDDASKELRKLRRAILIAEEKIEEKLNAFMRNSQNKTYLQESFISKRHGKLTIPIKAAYKTKVAGTVIESTDKTVFMELSSVSKYSSELLQLQIDESVEIYKIISHLTNLVYMEKESIRSNIEIIAQLDMIFAKGKYSRAIDGISPKLCTDGKITIKGGKHPLLEGNVIPLDLEIGKDYRSLIITGPNAGGKTVVLKTVGLLTLAVQSGFQVPVGAGSCLSLFDQVFVDIGDNQSLENSLSTFSSHVQNLASIVKATTPRTLLLFDEIGSGTEPSEGAALAIAILEHLYHKGAITIATTHYNEIKNFSEQHPDFENAAMQFNSETLEPLYKLLIGKAGESNALWIAKKMGILPSILEVASHYMTAKDYNISLVKETKKATAESLDETPKEKDILEKGDKVLLLDTQLEAIVYQPKTNYEPLLVYCNGDMREVQENRTKRLFKARDLYPEGYDLDT